MPNRVYVIEHLLNPGDLVRMPSLYREDGKQEKYEIEVFFLEMWFFNNLSKKRIRFNFRPFTKKEDIKIETKPQVKQNFVDLHLEITRKIDELLAEREKKSFAKELEPVFTTQQKLPLQEFVEFREPTIKTPEVSQFQREIGTPAIFREVNQEEFFEIVPPSEVPLNQDPLQENVEPHSWMQKEEQKPQRWFNALGKIKVKTKTSKPAKAQKKVNGFTKKQMELERTKQEIEARKRALEEAKEKEKQKEEELKEAKEEKIKQEKLKRLQQKKRLKEQKLKEKEERKLEKLRLIEHKKKEKEKLERLRVKEIEEKKAEKLRLIEQKKKEKEKLEKLKLKEIKAKEAEKLKQEELKKLEKEKEERLKAKGMIKSQKEKEIKDKKKEKLSKKEKKKKEWTVFSKKKKVKKEKEEAPLEIDELVKEKVTRNEKIVPTLDNEVGQLLPILDELLEQLPDEVIDEFANSEKFTLYEKVMKKYQNK